MIERDIADAIYTGITAAINGAMPVQFPGITFVPPTNDTWAEVIQVVNNIPNETWGNEQTYQGLINILFHFQVNTEGVLPILSQIDGIVSVIPKGLHWRNGAADVVIYDNPSLGSLMVSQGETFYCLTLKYRDFHTS